MYLIFATLLLVFILGPNMWVRWKLEKENGLPEQLSSEPEGTKRSILNAAFALLFLVIFSTSSWVLASFISIIPVVAMVFREWKRFQYLGVQRVRKSIRLVSWFALISQAIAMYIFFVFFASAVYGVVK